MTGSLPIHYIMYLSGAIFILGLAVVLVRKNAIMILMGIELMLNAANINFVAFSKYDAKLLQGQIMVVLIMVIAAAELSIALAIVLKLFGRYRSLDLNTFNRLKD